MKITLTFLVIIGSCLFGYSQQTTHSISVGGVNRSYIQYLPIGYLNTENLPVVFVLHGIGGNASQMTAIGFNEIADTARFIVIYPNGSANSFGQNSWNNGTLLQSTANDVGLFNQLIDTMVFNRNADISRIYVTGFSMGSIMSHHLACVLNDRIAAIGAMAGTMATSDISTCVPTYKTPVIHLHGTADATVPYNGSALPSLSLVEETMSFWRNVHGCDASADSTRIADVANDSLTIDRFVYANCDPLSSVELWRINGADHIYLYQPLNDITESIEVWKFMSKYQHNNPAPAGLTKENRNVFSYFPNPSNGYVHISSAIQSEIVLHDLAGKIVGVYDIQPNGYDLDLSFIEDGCYMLSDGDGNFIGKLYVAH